MSTRSVGIPSTVRGGSAARTWRPEAQTEGGPEDARASTGAEDAAAFRGFVLALSGSVVVSAAVWVLIGYAIYRLAG